MSYQTDTVITRLHIKALDDIAVELGQLVAEYRSSDYYAFEFDILADMDRSIDKLEVLIKDMWTNLHRYERQDK